MLTCKQNENTDYARTWTRDLGPMYVDLRLKPGCELAAQVATHLCAVQFANGALSINEKSLRSKVHDVLAAMCAMNIADGTIHYNDETQARPHTNYGGSTVVTGNDVPGAGAARRH